MENKDLTKKEQEVKSDSKMSLEELDNYSGGTIGNAKKEEQKPISSGAN